MSTMTDRQARGNMTSLTFPIVLQTTFMFHDIFCGIFFAFRTQFDKIFHYRGDFTKGDQGQTGSSLVKD